MSPEIPHAVQPEVVLAALNVSASIGLAEMDARHRLARFGPNTVESKRNTSGLTILTHQARSPVIYLLGTAAALAVYFGELEEGAAIAAVLVLNTVIGFFTELKAARSIEALRAYQDSGDIVAMTGDGVNATRRRFGRPISASPWGCGARMSRGKHPPDGMSLVSLSSEGDDFEDTAAILSLADLLISVGATGNHGTDLRERRNVDQSRLPAIKRSIGFTWGRVRMSLYALLESLTIFSMGPSTQVLRTRTSVSSFGS